MPPGAVLLCSLASTAFAAGAIRALPRGDRDRWMTVWPLAMLALMVGEFVPLVVALISSRCREPFNLPSKTQYPANSLADDMIMIEFQPA